MYMDRAALEDVLSHHQAIFAAIEQRNPQAAFDAMQTHIRYVLDYFRSR
jgi:DNA-binding FadR family transcriptional regulator